MNAGEVAELVVNRLTAGGEVCLNIEVTSVEKLVHDVFLEVRPWYEEPPYYVTLPVTLVSTPQGSEGTGGYVDLSTQNPPVEFIRRVHTVQSRYYHTGDIVRDLLLLPAAPLETERIEEHAAWMMTWPMVKELLGRVLTYKWDEQRRTLWVDDANEGAVTIEYVPEIASVDQVTNKKVITWIINMTEARTMQVLGRVRGKFRGGMTMETDASEMASEATQKIERLTEELKLLHFSSPSR